MVGSVHERVGGGGSNCSGDHGRTEGATKDVTKASKRATRTEAATRSFRPSPPVRPRGCGRARRFSVVDDIMGRCGCFVNTRFLGPLLVPTLLPLPPKAGVGNTHPFLRVAPILPASPPLKYPQGGDDDPDDGYYKLAITSNIGIALASFV